MKPTYTQTTRAFWSTMLSLVLSSYVAAHPSNILDKEISLNLLDQPMERILKRIETVAEISFMYSPNHVNIEEVISLQVNNRKLKEVLDELFAPRSIRYKVHEGTNTITLNKDAKSIEKSGERKFQPEQKDRQRVMGRITDVANGTPMAGVNIIIKGTTQGTTSDAEGAFALEAEQEDILVFSFIGYQTIEIRVGNQTTIDVQLTEDIQSLKEVIVNAGYYKVKEHEQTGNIAKLGSEEIEKQPVNNPLQAMQGRMAGVYIQQQSGVPGGAFNIQIRGQNSLRNSVADNGNRPLYIIDGVPFNSTPLGSSASANIIDGGNPLNTLNPADIESIEILKDADATAIYGSRGANGVVLITTKGGKSGKTEFTFNYYEGWGEANRTLDLLNTQQYLTMRNEAFANDQVVPGTFYSDHDLLSWDQTRYTDWQKELLGGTARMTNAQVSIAGGSEQTQFLIAGGLLKESTVFPGDFANKKYSGNFKVNHQSVNNKLSIDFSAYYLTDNNTLPLVDLTGQALLLPPNAPSVFTDDGELNWENSTWRNPLTFTRKDFETKTTNLLSNTIIAYKVFPTLQAKVNIGYANVRMDEYSSNPKASFDPNLTTVSSATFADRKIQTWITEPTLEYSIPLGEGTLTALMGTTLQGSDNAATNLSASGFTSDALLRNPQAASIVTVESVTQSEYWYSAMFGRINYNWKGKYLANLTGRRDASSRFGPGKQFANFGAIGAAWVFSEEPWMKNNPLSFGKIRASLGTTGSDQIADYGYTDLWASTVYSYDGSAGLYPLNLANPDYGWEENRKWEVALEAGLWKDRLNVSVSYYNHRSGNQLVGVPLPGTTGFFNVQANLPAEVKNTGVEGVLSSSPIETKDFTWTTSVNITFPRNELVSFPDIENSTFAFDYIVGKPLTVQPSFGYTGVNPETGVYEHRDVNNDGGLTFEDDLLGNKSVAQNFFGGFQNTFRYKGLSLDVFVQFVSQTGRNYLFYFFDRPGAATNQPVWVLDRWQSPGDQAPIGQFTQGFGDAFLGNLFNSYSDNRFGDASFVRLKNVSLSYRFPSSLLQKTALQQARLYVQAQNLATFTNYQGLDPENQSATLPPLRMITIGASITF
ncbi:MAG TPA: SusC/RagA family TonB-linked outer membrane protein [Cyclobacteriaceae bacterium]|nr:SusC/RagA family TonB-linked outer membrane protein [Cyclobacteriaceae bacterium]